MLTAAQVQRFHDDGYLVVPQASEPARIAEVRSLIQAVRSGEKSVGYFKTSSPNGPLFNAHLDEPLLMQLVCQASIREALGQLLGAPAMICQSMFFFGGSRTRPHQDEFFMAPKPAPLIGSWIAVQDVSVDDGPLGAIAGTHRGPVVLAKDVAGQWWTDRKVYDSFYDKVGEFTDHAKIVPLTAKAGDVIFFHGRVIHCGMEPSTPDRPRWSFVSHHYRSDAVMDDSNNGLPVKSVLMA